MTGEFITKTCKYAVPTCQEILMNLCPNCSRESGSGIGGIFLHDIICNAHEVISSAD